MKGHGTLAPGTRMPRCQDPGAKVHLVPFWFFWFRFGSSVTKKLNISIFHKKVDLILDFMSTFWGHGPWTVAMAMVIFLHNRSFTTSFFHDRFCPNRFSYRFFQPWFSKKSTKENCRCSLDSFFVETKARVAVLQWSPGGYHDPSPGHGTCVRTDLSCPSNGTCTCPPGEHVGSVRTRVP